MGLLEAQASLAGKTAVVLGGCGEIQGRAISLALAKAGVRLFACDIDEDGLSTIGATVEAVGSTIVPIRADVRDQRQLDAFYDRVADEAERVDILVNLPGGVKRNLFVNTTREDHARDIRLNYGYVVDSCYRAIPLMKRSGEGGSIINFTTIEAHRGAATYAVYAGAKAATTNFSRALAVELGGDQIRVNLLAPDTSPAKNTNAALYPQDLERIARLGPEGFQNAIDMYVPLKRAPSVEDLVNGVLFLASDLSRSITGTTLHIDGGTVAALGFIDWPFEDSFMPAPLGGTISQLFPENEG